MPKYFLTGLSHPVTFELEEGFNTVGRNPTNDLRLRDATISSFHCELVLKHDRVTVRDLGSSNGTFVEGRLVREGPLLPGAVLRLGTFELRLERREEEADAPQVRVPKLEPEALAHCVLLADGCPACLRHPSVHAAFRCARCEKTFCSECVRSLSVAGGAVRVFCPQCSGTCAALPVPPGASTTPPKRGSSIFGRLTQTIRIRFR